jgi:hypothetical protein
MYVFGDSFDLYGTTSDAGQSYWDVANAPANATLATGRFSGGRAWGHNISTSLVKLSGSNDAVHHVVVAYFQTAALSGTTLGAYIELFDGATAQCSIVFRSDGVILLTSGGPTGTVLATYTGAVTIASQWFAFEFEVVINNTTGSFRARVNNATSDSFAATSLNTRVSANNYANKIQIGMQANVVGAAFDDLLWRSDPASVPWVGDIRTYVRMPASDVSKQFTPNSGTANYSRVNEAQQDGATTYVYDNVVNDADFYTISTIPVTPASIVAVTARGFAQKSDAGSRTGALQLKSGGTTVQAPNGQTLSAGLWASLWGTYLTDPATGTAWTPTGVNNVQIGPVVLS